MRWEHRCSLKWMRKRQHYLTASDVKALLPVTKTGRKREVTDMDRLKVMAGKMEVITEDDCVSHGAAARGHIMEPYAIKALNELLGADGEHFYFWDDEVISVSGRELAFSPDAMDVPQVGREFVPPTAIAEVKSYSSERHLSVAYTPKGEIEERWQIACAMALLPSIDHAYLVLFNPKMKLRKLYVIRYDRDDLLDEIAIVLKVEDDWHEFKVNGMLAKPPKDARHSYLGGTEKAIMAEVERKARLNPV